MAQPAALDCQPGRLGGSPESMQLRMIRPARLLARPSLPTGDKPWHSQQPGTNSRPTKPVHSQGEAAACRWVDRWWERRLGVGVWSPLTLWSGRGDGPGQQGQSPGRGDHQHAPRAGTASGAPRKHRWRRLNHGDSAPPAAGGQATKVSQLAKGRTQQHPCNHQAPRQQHHQNKANDQGNA